VGVVPPRLYDDVVRRIAPLALVAAIILDTAGIASAQVPAGRCADRFGGSVFETSAAAGPVMVYGSGLTSEMTDRFATEYEDLAVLVEPEMGGLEGAVVCIFAGDIPIDAQALGWPEGHKLHAAAFGGERLVVVSAYLVGFVIDAGRAGLLQVAMWQVSGGRYPEPFGNDVVGWYRNRLGDQVETIHAQFVRANTGLSEPWPPLWTWDAGQMLEPLLWNPEFGYGGDGDFTNYAVALSGTGILSDPLAHDLAALDEGWRQLLFDESPSIPGGSRGWITGLILVIAAILAAVLMAWWGHYTKLRLERELREAVARERRWAAPVPERASVRPSASVGESRRDPRVGRGGADSVGANADHRDGPPSLREVGTAVDDMPSRDESGDDLFRHPGFDEEG